MIKNWKDYINESVKKHDTTESDIYKRAYELVDDSINDIFCKLHKEFRTESGDISPEDNSKLLLAQVEISKIISNQVHYNLGSDISKIISNDIDVESLSRLDNESNDVRIGDDVIMMIYNGGYTIYRGVIEASDNPDNESIGFKIGDKLVDVESAHKVVRVETYNDFCEPNKRILD